MKPKPKTDKTDTLAREDLGPLIRYAQSHPGTVAHITRRLSSLTAKPTHRQLVESWLHHDPAKWVHPRYGMGKLLLQVWTEIQAQADTATEPNPTPHNEPKPNRRAGRTTGKRQHRQAAACP